ncbi:MAG: hypothetical protein ABSF47_01435 [Minisyncoccia bacterium]|jgi:hypothetical protein
MSLTKQHNALIKEIDRIIEVVGFDYKNTNQYKQKTARLKAIKEQIIRGRVIMWHSFFDETMDNAISNYFFYKHKRREQRRIYWYSNKYSIFKNYLLERIPFRRKLELVVKIKSSWKKHKNILEKLDGIRNPLAHSFSPEEAPKKINYRGKNIFTLDGIILLENDMSAIFRDYSKLI